MGKIYVFGDILIEEQESPKVKTNYSKLGGAGNLALNLAAACPEHNIRLIWPYTDDPPKAPELYDMENLSVERLQFKENVKIHPGLRRRSGKELILRRDPLTDWSLLTPVRHGGRASIYHFRVRDWVADDEVFLYDLDSRIGISLIAIEWHYKWTRSSAWAMANLFSSLVEHRKDYWPTVYLDMRHPPEEELPFYPAFWKMNQKEEDALERNGIKCEAEYLLRTKGKDGGMVEPFYTRIPFCFKPSYHQGVDPVGSGDSFGAYFIASYLRSGDIKTAAKVGALAGGYAASKEGVITVEPYNLLEDCYDFTSTIIGFPFNGLRGRDSASPSSALERN